MARIFRRYKSTIYGNYRKHCLIDGAITGAAMSAVLMIRDWLSESAMSQPENFVTEVVMAVGIFWFTYRYRKSLPEQKVTLKELMLLGLGIGVIGSVVYGLWTWLRCGVLESGMVEFYNQQRIGVMEPADSSAQAKAAVELVKGYTAGDWAFIGAFRSAVMSIILAFFAALIFKTEQSPVVERQSKKGRK